MTNGGVFLLAVIAFFFLLWLVGGGQHKSIYTQGIFITPITSEGQQQQGYGPQITINKTITIPGGGSITASSTNGAGANAGNTSLIGKIAIVYTTQNSPSNPNQQYLEFLLTSSASSDINLNGWKFVSASSGDSAQIATSDATLSPKETILVVTSFPASDVHDTMQLVDENGNLVSSVTY